MKDLNQKLKECGIIPVIKIQDPKKAAHLAQALWNGGMPIAEITFRTGVAGEAMRVIRDRYSEIILGAGTVLTTAQVDEAIDAGAVFIVSPGLNPRIVKYCQDKGIPIFPGVSTPSEIECALELGLSVLKLFPAESLGGISFIKALSGPYGQVSFLPTGGISEANLASYLSNPAVYACGGSWMVPSDLMEAGDFAGIESRVRKAVSVMLGFELAHVGINMDSPKSAMGTAELLGAILQHDTKDTSGSIFVGRGLEVLKSKFLGEHGHIAFYTNDMERAMAFLLRRGFVLDQDHIVHDKNEKLAVMYLKDTFAGFAVHFIPRPTV